MGLRGDAVIAGIAEYAPERKYRGERRFTLEQWADLAALALDDAGLTSRTSTACAARTCASRRCSSRRRWPSTSAGRSTSPSGSTSAGPRRSAWCGGPRPPSSSVCATWSSVPRRAGRRRRSPRTCRGRGRQFGASSNITGSPQAEFDIPYGNLAQNGGYAMIANRYAAEYGYDPRATAKIAADQRANACANPAAVFHDEPITIDDVLASKMVADPLHLLEIVMPCVGGAAVVVTSADVARRARQAPPRPRRRVRRAPHAQDAHLRARPVAHADRPGGRQRVRDGRRAARRHRRRAAVRLLHDHRPAVDRGLRVLRQGRGHGLRARQRPDVRRQLPAATPTAVSSGSGRPAWPAGSPRSPRRCARCAARPSGHQVRSCDTVYCSGTGGIMSEQTALIVRRRLRPWPTHPGGTTDAPDVRPTDPRPSRST